MARIRKNSRVIDAAISNQVWGLYNLDTSATMFIDELNRMLLDIAPRFRSCEETLVALVATMQGGVDGTDTAFSAEASRRLDVLFEFGALILESDRSCSVLLVDPPCPERMVGSHGPAKGLCYLSAALSKAGLPTAAILDMRSVSSQLREPPVACVAYFAKYCADIQPDVIGVTAVSATIDSALHVVRLAKLIFPSACCVLGGPHASFEWKALLEAEPCLDAVILGEGEISFPLLVRRVTSTPRPWTFDDIQGVAWRDALGIAHSTGWSPAAENLDDLAMPDDHVGLLNSADYKMTIGRVISARGCTFKCSFCSTATFTGRRLRERSVENVVSELRYYYEHYGINRFTFDDDIFTIHRSRCIQLCEAICQSDLSGKIEWGCNTRLDCIDTKIIDALYEAGCRYVLFGVESGSPDVQDRFGKGRRSLRGFAEKMQYMLDRGMDPQLNFILGLPGETVDSVELIIALIRDIPNVTCSFNFLNVFPGTPLARDIVPLGIRYLSERSDHRFSVTAPTVATPTMSPDDQVKAYLRLEWFRYCQRNSTQTQADPANEKAICSL